MQATKTWAKTTLCIQESLGILLTHKNYSNVCKSFFLFAINCCHIFEITMLRILPPSTKPAHGHAGVIKEIWPPLTHTIPEVLISSAEELNNHFSSSWAIWVYSSEHDHKLLLIAVYLHSWTVKYNSLGTAVSETVTGWEHRSEEQAI